MTRPTRQGAALITLCLAASACGGGVKSDGAAERSGGAASGGTAGEGGEGGVSAPDASGGAADGGSAGEGGEGGVSAAEGSGGAGNGGSAAEGGEGGGGGAAGGGAVESGGGTAGDGGTTGEGGSGGLAGAPTGGASGGTATGGSADEGGEGGGGGVAGGGAVESGGGTAGDGGTVGCSSYDFIKGALRSWEMPTEHGPVSVLLVPLMAPAADAEHPVAFTDVYHLFPAAIVVPLLIEAGDIALAGQVLEFYFQLFEDPTAHRELWNGARFDGFPEIYKDLSGPSRLNGDIQPDPGIPATDGQAPPPQFRGMGPNAWLANAVLHYYFALEQRGSAGDAAQMARARALAEALGSWLGYLQDEGLDDWLSTAGKTRPEVPWLDGGIAGTVDEELPRRVSSGPYTEGSAAAYAVFRKLEQLETAAGDGAKATEFRERADGLANWFRYVIDGATGRVFVGRTLDGKLSDGLPSVTAEAIDTYAFLVLAGIADAELQRALIERVRVSCVTRTLTDREGRVLDGLAFGPQARNAIFWGPHGQVDMAAWLLQHEWEPTLYANMQAASDACGRLTTFSPDGTLGEYVGIDDWTGKPSECAWVGWQGQHALEPTAWKAMRERLAQGFNILGPVTWAPAVHAGDALLGSGPLQTVTCAEVGAPSGPYADASASSPLDADLEFFDFPESAEVHGGRRVMVLELLPPEGGADPDVGAECDQGAVCSCSEDQGAGEEATHAMVFRYVAAGTPFEDTFTFYLDSEPGITHLELEFKDTAGNGGRFVIPLMPSSGLRWVSLDLTQLPGVNRQGITEILLHAAGYGRLQLDGFLS